MIFSQDGVHIANKDVVLEWGSPVDNLVSRFGAIVEKFGDTYFAYWGEDAFIKGSAINLRTPFRSGTLFHEMEYSVSGDSASLKDFGIIKDYLVNLLGQPTNMDNQINQQIKWITPFVRICLELEDYKGLNLSLLIRQNNAS